jgi:hypothetical protein
MNLQNANSVPWYIYYINLLYQRTFENVIPPASNWTAHHHGHEVPMPRHKRFPAIDVVEVFEREVAGV